MAEIELSAREWPGRSEPVIALHGVTATSMSFVGVAEELAGTRHLLALDLRGHGDSARPAGGDHSIAQHARDVAAAMRARGLLRRPIVGHSFGAYVATALAIEAPELVSALVFVDGGYPPIPPGLDARAFADFAMMAPLSRVRARHADVAGCVAMWRALPGLADAEPAWLEAFAANDAIADGDGVRAKATEQAVRAAYADMIDVAVIEARLRALTVPVYVVRAEHGAARGLPPVVPDDVVAALRRCVANVAVRTVGGSNHFTIVLARPGARVVARLVEELA
jgi:pimeloyl-ACP methyl ester carboxylesterase